MYIQPQDVPEALEIINTKDIDLVLLDQYLGDYKGNRGFKYY